MDPLLTINEEVLPLSLKTNCLLYIVVNINGYSSSVLSLLPASLRRNLLAYLPAVAVHRLEEMPSFTDGIDTDALVWSQLYSTYTRKLPRKLRPDRYQYVKDPFDADLSSGAGVGGPVSRTYKEKLMDIAVNQLIDLNQKKYMMVSRTMLPFTILVTMRNLVINSHIVATSASVKNFMRYFHLTHHDTEGLIISESFKLDPIFLGGTIAEEQKCINDCVDLLASHFNKYPKSVITQIIGPKLLEIDSLAQYLFSRVECFCLCGTIVESFPLQTFFQNTASLKTLLINTELSSDDSLHRDIAPYFSSARKPKIGGQSTGGFDQLEQLSAGKFLKHEQQGEKNRLVDVALIISHQKKLEFVRLYGYFGHTSATITLMSTLLKLISQSQLKSLMVEGHDANCQVSAEKFAKLVLRFIQSPAQHPQYLAFTNFQLFNTPVTSIKMAKLITKVSNPPKSSSSLPMNQQSDGSCLKSLNITGIQLPDSVVQLLSQTRVTFHTLKLALDSTTASYYMGDLKDVFGNSRVYVLTWNSLVDLDNSGADELLTEQVAYFISCSSIESLTVNSIKMATPSMCETIFKALSSKAVANESLSLIHFNDCLYDEMSPQGLEYIFTGLFILAQSVDLEVKLTGEVSGKFMTQKHIDIIYKAWKMLSVGDDSEYRRIYRLDCCVYVDPDDDLEQEYLEKMEEMIEIFCPIFRVI